MRQIDFPKATELLYRVDLAGIPAQITPNLPADMIHIIPVERAALDEATGYKRSSRDAYLQRLGARRLVEAEGRSRVKASASLFD